MLLANTMICHIEICVQSNMCFTTTAWAHKQWSYMRSGHLSEVQIYGNVGPYSC